MTFVHGPQTKHSSNQVPSVNDPTLIANYHCACSHLSLVVMRPPYEISETGWGEFEVVIKIFFADSAEKPVSEP